MSSRFVYLGSHAESFTSQDRSRIKPRVAAAMLPRDPSKSELRKSRSHAF
jgi:hypothetical protein